MAKKKANLLERLADLKELLVKELQESSPSEIYLSDLRDSIVDLEQAIVKRPYEMVS